MMTRFFCLAAASLGLTSCLSSGSNNCSATLLEPALTATGPKTIAVNQTASFTVSYVPQSTCGTFEGFLEQASTTANAPIIGVRVKYSDCNCPTSTLVAQATYSFKPTQAGTYYLNFVTSNSGGFITDTLVAK